MRIERSICPLTMLVEKSMLTMFATILVRRRLWPKWATLAEASAYASTFCSLTRILANILRLL